MVTDFHFSESQPNEDVYMDSSEPKKRFGNSRVIALTRSEWERDLETNVELGLATPGETYEEYLDDLRKDFGWVCVPSDPSISSPQERYERLSPEGKKEVLADLKEHSEVLGHQRKLHGKPITDKVQ
jgi:hypothetical protein